MRDGVFDQVSQGATDRADPADRRHGWVTDETDRADGIREIQSDALRKCGDICRAARGARGTTCKVRHKR